MARYLALRLLDAVPTVLLVLTLVFVAMRILPGDPALAALGDNALPEQLRPSARSMGLNPPLWQQFSISPRRADARFRALADAQPAGAVS